jgi:hypothetical protein
VSQHPDVILDNATIKKLIGDKCDGVIGQLTEVRQLRAGCVCLRGGGTPVRVRMVTVQGNGAAGASEIESLDSSQR